ncbi:MAG: TVP38/TMEM64 family protein, partial [Gemmatimonadaceae bacterium]|nr:TVP38/TMEM64 family protein [Gloeobacterales cyanobacterium ES-bin-141]
MDIQGFQTALLQNLQGTLLAWGIWGPLAGFALSALRPSLPFPLFLPISVANGMVFGPWVGSMISWTGTAAGSCIGFSISRRMGQPVVYRWLKAERWRKLEAWVARKGFIAVILGRLTPAIPYGPFSYVVGASPMPLGAFLAATL